MNLREYMNLTETLPGVTTGKKSSLFPLPAARGSGRASIIRHASRLRRDHIPLLEAAGVTTLTQLAELAPGTPVAGLRPAALTAITQQARLQRAARPGERPPYELLPCADGRGFALLPEPSAGDVMFDFEGDPFWTPAQGLMFLSGLLLREGAGWRYEAIWGHDRAGEKGAFERLVDLLTARLAEHPGMHVYHYSAGRDRPRSSG